MLHICVNSLKIFKSIFEMRNERRRALASGWSATRQSLECQDLSASQAFGIAVNQEGKRAMCVVRHLDRGGRESCRVLMYA